nr:RNA-dependent RNA polymerase [Narnavirus sp.]
MSTQGNIFPDDVRTSAQEERPGTICVDEASYRAVFSRENPGAILHGWDNLHPRSRWRRVNTRFCFDLKPDVIAKLSRLSSDALKRIVNLTTGFEDVLLFSQPENYLALRQTGQFKKFLRWAVSLEVHRPGLAVREWKSFLKLAKWRAVRSETPGPALPLSFPGVEMRKTAATAGLTALWHVLAPWLIPIWNHGFRSKQDATRFAHFATSRNLPAGTQNERREALETHAEVLCGDSGPDNKARRELLYELARIAGQDLQAKGVVKFSHAHLSVTNSASIYSSINDGGRAAAIRGKFREWLMFEPQTEYLNETWFGKPYWLKPGYPRWMTMCRTEIPEDQGRPGDSALLLSVDFTPGKFRYEDPLYALDQFTGYQLLQWSIEEGISTRALEGTPYRSEDHLRRGPRNPEIRATAIGEPGGKSRVVTVGEDWLTIFLQPVTHALMDIFRNDASARAGLSRGWQGFEYIKAWSTKDESRPPGQGERYILTSDLTTATDYCPFGYGKALMKGFFKGLGISGVFLDTYVDLLLSPRTYLGPDPYFMGSETKRGSLMGDPGTKIVLSLFNKCAEMEAMLRWSMGLPKRPSTNTLIRHLKGHGVVTSRFRLFAFSGDDHIGIGPPGYLREITKAHIKNGLKVSESTNFISPIAGFYCEEIIFIGNPTVWRCWGRKVPLYLQPYEENPHVDALKIRLFSLCTKEHEGKNETNPAIGMASSLRAMLAWFKEGWESVRPLCSYRFAQKMRKLLPQNLFLRAIPRQLGGLGAPCFGYPRSEFIRAWEDIPDILKKCIHLTFRGLHCDHPQISPIRRLLSGVTSMSTLRGVDSSQIEEQVRSTLSSELCMARPVHELRPPDVDELRWENMRLVDKLNTVSRSGKFLPVGEALQIVMRPYIFRDLLFPEESIAHGINPDRRRSYRQIPWPVRYERLLNSLGETISASPEIRDKLDLISPEDLWKTRDDLIQAINEDFMTPIPKEIILIPREVILTPSLCTMSTSGVKF